MNHIPIPDHCASCRWCCVFDAEDCWEIPCGSDGNPLFIFNLEKTEGNIPCPHLGENGCVLDDDKPLDCKMWPFRKMNGRLAVCTDCPSIAGVSEEEIAKCAAEIDDATFERMTDKPYHENYRLLQEA